MTRMIITEITILINNNNNNNNKFHSIIDSQFE
jgi:hypothetical protein